VRGYFNGTPVRATLVPVGGGRHRLYINAEMRKRAKVDTGDKIQLVLEEDTEPRIISVPVELTDALDADVEAKALWDQLPKSEKNEILAYLNWIKRPETLRRNIDKLITKHLKKKLKS
jgi:uncharacterized protein YdeI (YjbR/CyaY-like superfamily)